MKTRIKVCGVSTPDIARLLVELGVDALGFIFHPASSRNVEISTVRDICTQLPAFINKVGVFVNQSPQQIMKIVQESGLDTIQLHGDQQQDFIDSIRSLTTLPLVLARRLDLLDHQSLSSLTERGVNSFLLDKFDPAEYGGTGHTLDLGADFSAKDQALISSRIILAGGIRADNVATILESIQPYALDLSSSLEREKGVKDPDLIVEFMKVFRKYRY